MNAKVLILILLIFSAPLFAQSPQTKTDELLKHLSAAETYQISGDLDNAASENKAIIGIALQRIGNIAIEEGRFNEAVKILNESIVYKDSASIRTDLAVAYLRLNQFDKALEEARKAVEIDPKLASARYILGNIYFTQENYQAALPELEKVMLLAPDIDTARALGLTYLHLKQLDRAKLLFDEIQSTFKQESPELHILFGQAFEQTNYPLEAEREFKRALTINPKQSRASFFLGYVILQYGGSERLAEAALALEKELELTPNDFYANFFAGVVASSENKHEKAIQYLQKAAQISPNRGEVYLFLGQSQIELNDLASAERNLRRAIELEKTDSRTKSQARRTHFLLGRLLIKANRKEEGEKELAIARKLQQESLDSARDEINQILGQVVATNEVKPNETGSETQIKLPPERVAEIKKIKLYLGDILAQSFNNLGVIASQNKQLNGAVKMFSAALEWKPDFPNLNRNLGIITFRNQQFENAITPLSQHLQANPNDNLIRQMLGASYYFTGNYAKSLETLKPFESVITTNAELAYFYGISLIQLKRNQEAVPIFNKLAEISQNNPASLFYAAQGFMILGDYEKSAKEFRQVILLSPNTQKANYFIGQSMIRLNRFDEAEKAFSRELELDPNDVLSKYHLALTFIERKIEPEKTIKILEETISLKSDYADARYQLGKIYLEKNEVKTAIDHLEIAAASDANKDFIHYQLSIAYRKASRKEEADRELKRYQELKAANRKADSPM